MAGSNEVSIFMISLNPSWNHPQLTNTRIHKLKAGGRIVSFRHALRRSRSSFRLSEDLDRDRDRYVASEGDIRPRIDQHSGRPPSRSACRASIFSVIVIPMVPCFLKNASCPFSIPEKPRLCNRHLLPIG